MTDAVVVLGAAMRAPGVPGPALARRLEHGVGVFAARAAGHLLLSGGTVGPPPAEAEMMRALALARGVAAEQIVVEDRSRNTFENAVYCGQIIRERAWERVVVVTDAFHLRRALYIFRTLGLPIEGEGVPRPADTSRLRWACAYAADAVRLVRSALLFRAGAHHAVIGREWHGGG